MKGLGSARLNAGRQEYFMGITDAWLDRFIESQIFFPDPTLEFSPTEFGLEFEDIRFETSDGIGLHGWLIPAERHGPLLLFFHGNAGNISHRVHNIYQLNKSGISVFIIDYRGYGLSEGKISEKGFYLDAEAAYLKAVDLAAEEERKLIIFGRSLGGVAAVHVAHARPCEGVILESTFTNLAGMARAHFPFLIKEKALQKRFNSVDKIGTVKAPILFFHGDRDDIVPIELGQALFEAAPEPKEFVTLPGAGHNDTYVVAGPGYFEKFTSFVDGKAP
jgi:fermentation-respiration switch protein FrsA (DUF1100 family)